MYNEHMGQAMQNIHQRLAQCDSQHRAATLLELTRTASEEDAKTLLSMWFNACDAIGHHAAGLREQFERVGFFTDGDDRDVPKLPIRVYRATWEEDKPESGLSWTTDIEIARRFARGFFGVRSRLILGMFKPNQNALIWGGVCYNAHAYLNSRNERELVASDVRKITVVEAYGTAVDE